MSENPEYWQPWPGPTGTTGPEFLGVTGAVTGGAFFGVTGAAGPTGMQELHSGVHYLYDRARIELVGASDAMIRATMYDVMLEFFNDSSLWLETIPGQIYPMTQLYYLQPGNPQSLGDPFPEGRIIRLAGVIGENHFPQGALMPQPPVMMLQFIPSNEMSVWATVVKVPKAPHDGGLPHVPNHVVEKYEPWLLAGIKGRLMQQPNRPYSDAKNGILQYQTFRQGVNMARVAALRGNVQGGQAWAYPQTFRIESQRGWVVTTGNQRRF